MAAASPRFPGGQTVRAIADAVRGGRTTALAVCTEALARARDAGEALGAMNAILDERALEEARAVDRAVADGGDPGPLAGVPVAIKDNICTEGSPTTCSSKVLAGYVPPYDATAVARLRGAGAVIVAKTNMDEFAMGSSNENSAFRPCLNPWDTGRVPGGSSGGSTVAVAAGIVPAALGSETGGSVRQPAALCGVVGVKPTYGRVSRYGLIAFASSLDHIGVLAANVTDAARVLSVVSGHDPNDSTSAPDGAGTPGVEPAAASDPEEALRGLSLGVPREYFVDGIDPEVERPVRAAIDRLAAAGADIREVSLPHTRHAIPAYYLIATAEASSNLARYDGVRYGVRADGTGGSGGDAAPPGLRHDLREMYCRTRTRGLGDEVRRRIMLGTYALSAGYYDAYYLKAQKVRTLLRREFDQALETVDLLVTPTSPTPAFRLGEKTDDPMSMYLSDVYTATANLAGLPAVSIPCGLSGGGLPVGLQLLGRPFGESAMLSAAAAAESVLGVSDLRPPAASGGGDA